MNDAERFKLLHGPYRPPKCKLGDSLFCEQRGWVNVQRISNGLIPWPQTIVGRNRTFILTGDLVNAVLHEAAIAVCHWWGVTPQTVTVWRKALDVATYNEGTRQLHSRWTPDKLPPEVQAAARAKANSPEANVKKALAKRGKAAHPNQAKALAELRQYANNPEAREKHSQTLKERGFIPPAAGRPWTKEEDALLFRRKPSTIARLTGRTLEAVYCRLQEKRRSRCRRRWTAEEDALLGKLPDLDVVERTGRTLHGVRQRRRVFGLVRGRQPPTAQGANR